MNLFVMNVKESLISFAHRKNHKKYSCDHCEKSFKIKEIKDKHIRIAHEGIKLSCHFYKNKKNCPNNAECIFLHEE